MRSSAAEGGSFDVGVAGGCGRVHGVAAEAEDDGGRRREARGEEVDGLDEEREAGGPKPRWT